MFTRCRADKTQTVVRINKNSNNSGRRIESKFSSKVRAEAQVENEVRTSSGRKLQIMKPNTKSEKIAGQFFEWRLYRRGPKFYADGRGNTPPLGRHTLDCNTRDEALKVIFELDFAKAVEMGKAKPIESTVDSSQILTLAEGRRIYEEHLARPDVAGGPSAETCKRYRAVLDKFFQFLEAKAVSSWNAIDARIVESYLRFLEADDYEDATLYLECTTIKQVIRHLIEAGRLPESSKIRIRLRKSADTTTYCYTLEQFEAMLTYCEAKQSLQWLGDVITSLGYTGLRIGELASLRWADIDLTMRILHVTNDSARKSERDRRRTKNRKNRSLPISGELLTVLKRLQRHSDGLVFRGPKGGKLNPDVLRRAFVSEVLTSLAPRFPTQSGDVGFADGRLHSFRHFFCSWAANNGVPERVLMTWLGHSNSAMVQRYYHLDAQESRKHMNRLKLADGEPGSCAEDSPAA